MNKQRKVVITTTYNEMGIIIDTKAEEVAQPEVAKDTNVLTKDCISRQAAIDAVYAEMPGLTFDGVLKILYTLSPAQPERKRGKWLPDNRPGGGFWVCSCCKFPSEAFAADKLYKYCPVCGCRMDEGD